MVVRGKEMENRWTREVVTIFLFLLFFFVSHFSFNRGLLNALVFLQTFTKATIMRNKNKREVMKFERSEQFVNYSLED